MLSADLFSVFVSDHNGSLVYVNKVTLTGWLPSSSSQNSLLGSEVAGSSQKPMPGVATFSSCATEGTPRSVLACGEVAGFLVNIGES